MYFNQRVTIDELLKMLDSYKYKEFHIHHTWKPNYTTLKNSTPEKANTGMKNTHIKNGWGDIGQHISTFPDGTILIGRNFSKKPVSIANRNTGNFAMEQVGDFDLGKDIITVKQRQIVLELIKYFSNKGTKIVFHRDYSSKTCPGTSLHKSGLIEASDYYLNNPGELRKWITGEDVAELQKKLGVKVVDGSFGNDTEKALKEYQSKNKLPVTGIYDNATRNFMEKGEKPVEETTYRRLFIHGVEAKSVTVKEGKSFLWMESIGKLVPLVEFFEILGLKVEERPYGNGKALYVENKD